MAIAVSDLKVTVRGILQGQNWQFGCWWRLEGAAFLTADPIQVGEAWWNDFKTTWRAWQLDVADFLTQEVFVEEEGLAGQYATYVIPVAEQTGSRTLAGGTNVMPSFNALGLRQTVGSRVTRPGQKRFPGVGEDDQSAGVLVNDAPGLLDDLGDYFSNPVTLGAPVATGTMHPEVCRIDPEDKTITARQDVTGYVANPNVTSQVSRKIGHGS